MAYILTYSGFMVFQLFIVLSLLSGTRNELAEKAASITVGSINMIISGIIAITLVYTATFIVIPKITEYKRKIYPIQDTTKNENP